VRDALRARGGRDLQASDNRLDFALRLVELLESDAQRDEMGVQARRFVQEHFSWEIFAARLEEMLSVAAKRGAADDGSGSLSVPARQES
jgi:glycosyltransferase involved in cell wall biosynthesis